jgi:cell division protein FtsQ
MRSSALPLRRSGVSITGVRAALTPSPRLRRSALVAVLLTALIAGLYLFWLRDSSLVAVDQVTVTGVTTRDGERLRSALASTARTMTTLHVDHERLEEAAAVFPIVRRIEVTTDFPHGMTVRVIEHRPVALLDAGGQTLPIAGDGTVLTGLPTEADLPRIETSGQTPQRQLPPGAALDAAIVAGGAPPAITARIESIGREGGARGVVAQVKDGPEIVFGSPDRAAAKWAAAVRVLADDEASGATYVDVRIPERPVAGGLPVETVAPVAPVGETSIEPVIPPVDPAATTPVDPAAATPAPVSPTPSEPVVPTAPEATGGLTP